MELAGFSFLDSPGSGALRFREPKALKASALNLTLNRKDNHPPPQKKHHLEQACDYSG